MIWILCLLLFISYADECTQYNLGRVFSDCGVHNTRSAYYFWHSPCEGGLLLPPPVHNLDCTVKWEPGFVLDMDDTLGISICIPCKENTYSIGGGMKFDGEELQEFSNYDVECWTNDWVMWYRNANCTHWHYEDGEIISGQTDLDDNWVEFELEYMVKLVKPGYLSFRYRKETRMEMGFRNGEFALLIDDDVQIYNSDVDKNAWETAYFNLTAGSHKLLWTYQKYASDNSTDLLARIDSLHIVGTDYADHSCYPCVASYSLPGSTECSLCQKNHYFAGDGCIQCPDGTYSAMGAIGPAGCEIRPACSEMDYSETYTNCIGNKRSKTYEWNTPTLWDTTKQILPENVPDIECTDCNPGQFHMPVGGKINTNSTSQLNLEDLETVCTSCPDGQVMVEQGEIKIECEPCANGTYAPKLLNITFWSPMPTEFANSWVPANGDSCEYSSGWISRGSYISTGQIQDPDVSYVLSRTVNITNPDAYAEFSFEILDNDSAKTHLHFAVDGIIKGGYTQSDGVQTSTKYPLSLGEHKLKWTYHHKIELNAAGNDVCHIHSILVNGSDEGGASECVQCPAGSISSNESTSCTEWPPGFTSDATNSKCDYCEAGKFSDRIGGECEFCPENTIPSPSYDYCYGRSHTTFQKDHQYELGPLVGEVHNAMGVSWGICNNPQIKVYCYNTHYGGIHNGEEDYYVSVMNPSELNFPKYARYNTTESEDRRGYAWGLMETKNLAIQPTSELKTSTCVSSEDKVLVNFGTRVKGISELDDMIAVEYTDGDVCDLETGETFTSRINLICDLDEGDGWPTFVQIFRGCEVIFQWKSRYACSKCLDDQIDKLKGGCHDGFRDVREFATANCVLTGKHRWGYREECSEVDDLLKTWQVIVLLIGLVSFATCTAVFAVCCCKQKRQYDMLMESDEGSVDARDNVIKP